MPARRRPSSSLSAKTTELALAVPQVVAHRLLRMAHAGPHLSARDRKEFARMIAEKNSAFGESWNAMALQMLQSQRTFAAALALAATAAAVDARQPCRADPCGASAAGHPRGHRQGARAGAPPRRRQREAARAYAFALIRRRRCATRPSSTRCSRSPRGRWSCSCSSRSRGPARRGGARSSSTTSSTANRRRCRRAVSIPNRNYMNLLELPMLFYVVCLVLYVTAGASTTAIALGLGLRRPAHRPQPHPPHLQPRRAPARRVHRLECRAGRCCG